MPADAGILITRTRVWARILAFKNGKGDEKWLINNGLG